MVIILDERKTYRVDHAPCLAKIAVTRVLTRNLFAVANLLVPTDVGGMHLCFKKASPFLFLPRDASVL